MKALVLEKYNHLVFKDVPDPEYSPDDVLIRVKACGICGSDIHGLDGKTGRRIPPIIMGHEAAGIISKKGSNVKNWKVGDRVTFDSTIYQTDDWYTKRGLYNLSDNRRVLGVSCDEYQQQGAMAQFVAVPQHILHQLPENVTYNQAALVEPAAVASHSIGLTPVSKGDTALVLGVGIVGSFVVQMLKLTGCDKIIAVDILQERLDMALDLGADVTLKSDACDIVREVHKHTHGRGADVAFEVIGLASTITIAINSLRKGGFLTLIGNVTPNITLPLQSIVTRQIRLQGSCAICGEYPQVLDMIAKGKLHVNGLISATVPLSEGAEWFKKLYNKEPGLLKVILNP
jgi:L-iditol 2-dehydrogenase